MTELEDEHLLECSNLRTREGELQPREHIDFLLDLKAPRTRKVIFARFEK